ncbi:MAG: hypothetical protein AB1437_16440 [Pseudomonadota bacterium]
MTNLPSAAGVDKKATTLAFAPHRKLQRLTFLQEFSMALREILYPA